MARHYDLLVFDWDGTLMDSTAHITHSIQNACRELGLPVPDRQAASHVIGLRLDQALHLACPGLDDAQHKALTESFIRHYRSSDDGVTLFDGVREGLHALREHGVFMAVATGNSRVGLNRLLAETGLGPLFDATRTVDECHSKPHPAMLQEISDELGVELARTVMIGDTSHDLNMALNARAHGVGVSYGAHDVGLLEDCQPQVIVHSFAELQQWLLARLG